MKTNSTKFAVTGKVAMVVVAAVVLLTQCRRRVDEGSKSAEDATSRRLPVVLTPVREMTFEDRICISGNVEARNTALVSARIPGVLDNIFVEEGDTVEVGERLFQTNKEKLTQAVEIAEQQVAVASAAVRASASPATMFTTMSSPAGGDATAL